MSDQPIQPEDAQPKAAPPPADKKPSQQPGKDADEPLPAGDEQADHSMNEETDLGWDHAPLDKDGPDARHPRQRGQGGTLEPGQESEDQD